MSDQDTALDVRLSDRHDWLVGNYGARCTLVSAASVLQLLGAKAAPKRLVRILEEHTRWKENARSLSELLPFWLSYLGRLDRGIEAAARAGGIEVKSKTTFIFGMRKIQKAINSGSGVVLNCIWAPSGSFSHSVVAFGYRKGTRQVLTLDPNDATERWTRKRRHICSVTIISAPQGQ